MSPGRLFRSLIIVFALGLSGCESADEDWQDTSSDIEGLAELIVPATPSIDRTVEAPEPPRVVRVLDQPAAEIRTIQTRQFFLACLSVQWVVGDAAALPLSDELRACLARL